MNLSTFGELLISPCFSGYIDQLLQSILWVLSIVFSFSYKKILVKVMSK